MANVYQVKVISIEPAANGTLNADVFVQQRVSANPDVWKETLNGHFTIVLQATDILAIVNGTGTTLEKRKALKDLIKAQALARGVDVADEAYLAVAGLLTFPADIVIR